MANLSLTPFSSLRVTKQQIPRHKLLPNTSIQQYPLLIYYSCFLISASASSIESHLRAVGAVSPQWRYTMFNTTHFHSTTHEVLCVSSGYAKLCFGGEENPDRLEIRVEKGDVIVIPAGVGHRLLEDLGGFEMVGSYPKGTSCMCYGEAEEEEKVQGIQGLSWFIQDPIYTDKGPVLDI